MIAVVLEALDVAVHSEILFVAHTAQGRVAITKFAVISGTTNAAVGSVKTLPAHAFAVRSTLAVSSASRWIAKNIAIVAEIVWYAVAVARRIVANTVLLARGTLNVLAVIAVVGRVTITRAPWIARALTIAWSSAVAVNIATLIKKKTSSLAIKIRNFAKFENKIAFSLQMNPNSKQNAQKRSLTKRWPNQVFFVQRKFETFFLLTCPNQVGLQTQMPFELHSPCAPHVLPSQ
jgi:hypothetical protein